MKCNRAGICAGLHRQIVFKLPLVAVVDEINTAVDAFITDSRKRRYIDERLTSAKVMDLSGLPFFSGYRRRGIRALECHREGDLSAGVSHADTVAFGCERDVIRNPARQKAGVLRCLTSVFFESDGTGVRMLC